MLRSSARSVFPQRWLQNAVRQNLEEVHLSTGQEAGGNRFLTVAGGWADRRSCPALRMYKKLAIAAENEIIDQITYVVTLMGFLICR